MGEKKKKSHSNGRKSFMQSFPHGYGDDHSLNNGSTGRIICLPARLSRRVCFKETQVTLCCQLLEKMRLSRFQTLSIYQSTHGCATSLCINMSSEKLESKLCGFMLQKLQQVLCSLVYVQPYIE